MLCDEFSNFLNKFEAHVKDHDVRTATYGNITGHFTRFYMAFTGFDVAAMTNIASALGRRTSQLLLPPIDLATRPQLEDLLATISLSDAKFERKPSILTMTDYNIMKTSPGLLGWVVEAARENLRMTTDATPWQKTVEESWRSGIDTMGPLIAQAVIETLLDPTSSVILAESDLCVFTTLFCPYSDRTRK